MRNIFKILCTVFFVCCFTNLIAQTKIVLESKLKNIDNELCLGKKKYTGWVASYHQNGKLKSCFEVKKGLINGKMIEFWIYKQDSLKRFRDTIELNNLGAILEPLNSENSPSSYKPIKRKEYLQTNFIKNGIGIVYDSLGNKFGEGTYMDNKQNGGWTYYYQSRKLKAKGEFLNGNETKIGSSGVPINGRNNLWSFYFENGNLNEESNFIDGNLNGLQKIYFENGNLQAESNFKDGNLNGLQKIYFENGNLQAESNYIEDKFSGVRKIYHENGNLKEEQNYINYKANGIFKSYYDNGKIKTEDSFKDGLLNGFYKVYHENGNLKEEGNRKNGKLNGIIKIFNINGGLQNEGNFKDDLISGLSKTYYENGNLEREDNYVDGKLDGINKLYFENGKIKEEYNYKNGGLNGGYNKYYESGKLLEIGNYLDDKLSGLIKSYYENGNKKNETDFLLGEANGKSISFFENGNKKNEISYIKGEMNGVCKTFYPSGKIEATGNFDPSSLHKDKLIGDFYSYNEDGTLNDHINIDKQGNVININDKKQTSNPSISQAEIKKTYKCKCCKATINGITDGIDKNGNECNQLTLGLNFKAYYSVESDFKALGFNNVYLFLREEYSYCSLKCYRTCN
jgi:antitoxin component YwqK of YwqJK toxin-antitoxin module